MTNQTTQELFDEFTPDPQLQQVTEYAGLEFSQFIGFVMSLDPRLTRTEATLAAAGIIHGLPQLLLNNPDAIKHIRTGFEKMIAARGSHADQT